MSRDGEAEEKMPNSNEGGRKSVVLHTRWSCALARGAKQYGLVHQGPL